MSEKPTGQQISYARFLLRKLELDPTYVTLMHRRFGASDAMIGRRVEEWLGSFSKADLSKLIEKLKAEVGVEEDED